MASLCSAVMTRCKLQARCGLRAAVMLAGMCLPCGLMAQEALRMSLTGAEAAELRRKAASTPGFYNLKAGPTAWNFSAGLEIEASDNIRLSPDAKSDLLFRPRFDTQMIWPVTEQNSLNLRLGAGYTFYLSNTEFNRYFITPGTELVFDMYVGNLWLSFHDRISITEDTYQDPTIVGDADYSRLENLLGFVGVWDLNKVIVRFGYDHGNYINLASGNAANPDGQAELFFGSVGYLLKPQMTAGVESSASFVFYDEAGGVGFTEATQLSAGGFFEAQISQYMKGRAAVGYNVMLPGDGPSEGDDESGIYAQLGLLHRLNEYIDYTLDASRRVSFTFYGGSLDLYTVTLAANWHIMRDTRITTGFTYEHGKRLYSFPEEFDRVGPTVSIARRLTEHLTGGLRYSFYHRTSSIDGWDYDVNIVNLNLSYRF